MKIADIGMGKAVLEELIDRKKTQKSNAASNPTKVSDDKMDSFRNAKRIVPDMARMNELQKNFLKDTVGLQGLNELSRKAGSFDTQTGSYEKLSQELHAIVTGTKYNGESIISYVSTHVGDEKALYTLKSNLKTEIDNVKYKISNERKDIASYLVREENLEGVKGYFPQQSLKELAMALDTKKAQNLHRSNIGQIQALLGFEK